MSNLVIVESYTKISKIKSILPKNYDIIASNGHIMDLDPKNMSLDLNNNFKPTYKFYPNSKKIIDQIKEKYSKCDKFIIASDLDREGEFIAESLKKLLNLKDNYERIVFNEITKEAINNSLKNSTKIDYNKVHAQQTRRFMDRIFGYSLSPLLRKIPQVQNENADSLGCGRVQSNIVKIIIDKENEIKEFLKSNKSSMLEALGEFLIDDIEFKTYFAKNDNKKYVCSLLDINISLICLYALHVPLCEWKILKINKKITNKSPLAPYTTATLLSDASKKLRWNIKKVTDISQKLYEMGLVTYIRTDSTTLSNEALDECEKVILNNYGEKFYTRKQYKTDQDNAQEAHEAIRPCHFDYDSSELNAEFKKLYDLIWKRTVSSQMSKAQIESLQVILYPYKSLYNDVKDFRMIGSKSYCIFKGYTILYNSCDDETDLCDETDPLNINITLNSNVVFKKMIVKENVKAPPSRYNESELVKVVTKHGIVRPGTTSNFITKIREKNYVKTENIEGVEKKLFRFFVDEKQNVKIETFTIKLGSENNRMIPTKLGILVNDFLVENFPQLMDINFTSNLEKDLNSILLGKKDYLQVLNSFYSCFKKQLDVVMEKFQHIQITPYKNTKFQNQETIGKFNSNDILYLKTKYGFSIKTTINEQNIWVSVKNKPTEDEARKLFLNKLENNKPKSIIVKTFGKRYIVRKNDKNAFLQINGKKLVFIPIRTDPKKITKKDCEKLEKKIKS